MATALANDHFQEATVRMRAAPVLALSVRSRKPLSNRAAETAEFREQPKRRFQRQTPHAKPRRCWIEHSLACFKFRFLNRPLRNPSRSSPLFTPSVCAEKRTNGLTTEFSAKFPRKQGYTRDNAPRFLVPCQGASPEPQGQFLPLLPMATAAKNAH